MSKNPFLENAFGILGLSVDSTDREVSKRAREIQRLLSIGESLEYENDLPLLAKERSEKTINDALRALMSDKQKIKESFFWFTVRDSVDKTMFKYLSLEDYGGALELLGAKTAARQSDGFALRNRAIVESICFSRRHAKVFLQKSIKSWKEVIESEKYWKAFWRVYQLNNSTVDQSVVDDFRKDVVEYLSDFYAQAIIDENDYTFYKEFSDVFSRHGDVLREKIIAPVLNELDDCNKELERIQLADDENPGLINESSLRKVRTIVKKIDESTDKLYSLGERIWNSSKIEKMRDDLVSKLRKILLEYVKIVDEITKYGAFIKSVIELENQLVANDFLRTKTEEDRAFYKKESLKERLLRAMDDKDYQRVVSISDKLIELENNPEERNAIIKANNAAKVMLHANSGSSVTTAAATTNNTTESNVYYRANDSSDSGAKAAFWVVVVIIGIIIWAVSRANTSKQLDETLDACSGSMSNSRCVELQRKYHIKCTDSIYQITCEKN